ncbi:hypothetical protein [Staphylococcus saprophyticus]|uniref:hypothetical protein n=1 Tax=Staphylococcus saprophyticus TaxID=29385 RepID=UPI001C92D24A|nr:hypothetical protein [Staphylococcus saprophyticus]
MEMKEGDEEGGVVEEVGGGVEEVDDVFGRLKYGLKGIVRGVEGKGVGGGCEFVVD